MHERVMRSFLRDRFRAPRLIFNRTCNSFPAPALKTA